MHAEQSPEQKLAIVRTETARARTLYVGDGINDAPAMMAATVGMAVGQNSDVTAEAADVVAMENSLKKVDEFMHISRRMRSIALQSAVGGMALSRVGMAFAPNGYRSPVAGPITPDVSEVWAVRDPRPDSVRFMLCSWAVVLQFCAIAGLPRGAVGAFLPQGIFARSGA